VQDANNIRCLVVIYVVYQREKVQYMSNMNALTFMKVEEGIEVDWAHLCTIICALSWIDGPKCKRRCKWMGNKKIVNKSIIWN
jgi:hypothetical protein